MVILNTPRLILRQWRDADRGEFARMNVVKSPTLPTAGRMGHPQKQKTIKKNK
jgi:hypothetical protein